MPACPNCGRQTLRTKDWACQWCGYPLLSRAYKKIDKTFKELQEERSAAVKVPPPEPEPEPELDLDAGLDLKTEPPPEPEPAPEPVAEPAPKFRIAPEPPPKPEPAEPLPELPPTPDVRHKPKSVFKPESGPEPEPAPPPEAETAPGPESTPVQLSTPAPAPQLEPRSRPKPPPEPEPPPVVPPSLESIRDGSVLTVDELDALFKADRMGAHASLMGKTVAIKGFVDKVFIRDHIDVRYIVLTGARKKVVWPVRCNFGKEAIPQMNRLEEGQEVSLRGKYDSYGKNIIFKDCVLV